MTGTRHGRPPPSGPRVAIATSRALPGLDADGPLLIAALEDAGMHAQPAVWDDPAVDWDDFDVVLIRSTWDYVLRREEFLGWASRCRRTANPARVLGWNTDKRYLHDLAGAGVPVVPTAFLEVGQPLHVPEAWRDGDIVVKPTVSASAADTGRFSSTSAQAVELVEHLHARGRPAMLQPYLPGVDTVGETALVHLAGAFSHAVRKGALLKATGTRAPLTVDDPDEIITPTTATSEQHAVARAALAAVPGGPEALSYARVDLVPDADGRPVVLELELTEPSLFLQHAPPAAVSQLAGHVARAAADTAGARPGG
jgi:hypothetical protein